ncbi:dTDP-4-dehydrorhamnose reductase [Aquimarina aggregata]|uniref:dTDP-4-dehydrorhamnose reductase n=1 Tax=Aquimarina aggregata TaxID=1642818 RepID=UPI0018E077E6|nr:dTDP-4-dehydrorhamnose reductase [Aquimarina aggregata]
MSNKYGKIKILVTGSSGQLGQCIKNIERDYRELHFYFANSKELDITQKQQIQNFFSNKSFDFIINCAAYTNVEQAEKEPKKAFLVNAQGVKNIAEVCKETNMTLVHISTDYVFDGKKKTPYNEDDVTNPINEYGKSKLAGEKYIQEILDKYFIIRTSWLYSEFGHNFFKTILKKLESESQLTITTSEIGTPTNANDLVKFILFLIEVETSDYGVFHYSNLGETTWFDFAKEILKLSGKLDTIKLEKTDNYVIFADRPGYSILSKVKSLQYFNLEILNWKLSLKKLIKN